MLRVLLLTLLSSSILKRLEHAERIALSYSARLARCRLYVLVLSSTLLRKSLRSDPKNVMSCAPSLMYELLSSQDE